MAEKQSKSTAARKSATAQKPKTVAKEPSGRKKAAAGKKGAAAEGGSEAPEQVERGQAAEPVVHGNPAVDTVRSWSGLSPTGGLTLQQVAERLHVSRAIAGKHLREAVEAGLLTLDQNSGVYRLAGTPAPEPAPVAEIVSPDQVEAATGPVMAHLSEFYRQFPDSGQIVQDVVRATGLDRRAIHAVLERGVASGELVRHHTGYGYRLAETPAPEPASEEPMTADAAETPVGDEVIPVEEAPAPETIAAPAAEATGAEAEPGDTSAEPADVPAVVDAGAAGGAFNAAMPIDSVVVVGNVRKHFDHAALAELAHDIKVNGILQPLLVRTGPDLPAGQFALVAGERRLRAAREAGLATVPVIIREMDARTAARAQLLENVHRSDLNALEEADGYAALLQDHGYTQTALAKELGVSQPHIANRLQLLKLPESVRDLISQGILAAATALALVRLADAYPDVAATAAKDMVTAKVPSAKAYEWLEEWLGSHMQRLEGWDAKCCGDHKECPCRRSAKQYGSKVPVCLDPQRFAKVEEDARQALIAKAVTTLPQTVAPDPPSPSAALSPALPVRPGTVQSESDSGAEGEETADGEAPRVGVGVGVEGTPGARGESPVPERAAEVLDLKMLPPHTYKYLDAARGDNPPVACRECPCLRLAKARHDGRLEWVCVDPKRHDAEERRRTRDRNKVAMAALATEKERGTAWAVSRVQETWRADLGAPVLGKVELAYFAAWILTAAKPAYDPRGKPRANLREYLAAFGVGIDNAAAPNHTHQGLAGQLLALAPDTIWRMCIEWPLVATDHGLGDWYRRKVDMPEGEACDLCTTLQDDLEPYHSLRPVVVPPGLTFLVCPKCRNVDLGRLGLYREASEGVDLGRATEEQAGVVREALGRRDEQGTSGPGRICGLCDDVSAETEVRRLYNHRWDGAPRGAWVDVCDGCREDREVDAPDLYGFKVEPPAEGAGEGLTEDQLADFLQQEADGEIEGHLAGEPDGTLDTPVDKEGAEVPASA